jgi:hypothetical protein
LISVRDWAVEEARPLVRLEIYMLVASAVAFAGRKRSRMAVVLTAVRFQGGHFVCDLRFILSNLLCDEKNYKMHLIIPEEAMS